VIGVSSAKQDAKGVIMIEEKELNLDEGKLVEALENEAGEENIEGGTPKEQASLKTEKTPEIENELEKEEEKVEEKKEEEEEKEEDTRFDKHPRFKQLEERIEQEKERVKKFEEENRSLREFKEKVGDTDLTEIERLKEATKVFKRHPELASKIQEIIDTHPYEREETNIELKALRNDLERTQNQILIEKYDSSLEKFSATNKIDDSVKPLWREIVDTRVRAQNATLDAVPKIAEQVLKDIKLAQRKEMAGYIENKSKEQRIPVSPVQKGKVIAQKKESVEDIDIVTELAAGIKSAHSIGND
jgi:small-conductance mechanosensitive channel